MLYQLEICGDQGWEVKGSGKFDSPREAIDAAIKDLDFPLDQIRIKVYNEDDHNWDEYPQCPLCWKFVFMEDGVYQCGACGWKGIFATQNYIIKVKNPDGKIQWIAMLSGEPISSDAITTRVNEEYPGYSILEIETHDL